MSVAADAGRRCLDVLYLDNLEKVLDQCCRVGGKLRIGQIWSSDEVSTRTQIIGSIEVVDWENVFSGTVPFVPRGRD